MAPVAGTIEPDNTSLDGPCPCDSCRFSPRCAAQRLACAAFVLFVSGAAEIRWQHAPRAPSADIFTRLYPEAA